MAVKNEAAGTEMDKIDGERSTIANNNSYEAAFAVPNIEIRREGTNSKKSKCCLVLSILALSVLILGSAGACTFLALEVKKLESKIASLNSFDVQEFNSSFHLLHQQVNNLTSRIDQIDSVSLIQNLSTSVKNFYHQVSQNYESTFGNSSERVAARSSPSCCGEGWAIFDANLTSGQHFIAPESGMSWSKVLTDPNSQSTCDMQGVLKIIFPQACNRMQNRRLQFDLYFASTRSGWNFDISDSTNNGYGGDAGHTSNAAEVHNIDEGFFV
ncbi:hypothetical protein SPONN_1690 [uncultured Candidatus Thioglobus sp.]|nr:hypothetical protein SPONN_1690 [uncultured Candidatus Thioglobus sp.]